MTGLHDELQTIFNVPISSFQINAKSERLQKAKFSAIALALREEQRVSEYRRQKRILENYEVVLPQPIAVGGSGGGGGPGTISGPAAGVLTLPETMTYNLCCNKV